MVLRASPFPVFQLGLMYKDIYAEIIRRALDQWCTALVVPTGNMTVVALGFQKPVGTLQRIVASTAPVPLQM
jgi:hypothetical protein